MKNYSKIRIYKRTLIALNFLSGVQNRPYIEILAEVIEDMFQDQLAELKDESKMVVRQATEAATCPDRPE